MKKFNLDNKKFKPIDNSDNGDVSADTIFHYRQENGRVWATYRGSNIQIGTLIGKIEGDKINLIYQQINSEDEFLTGSCNTIISLENGKVHLHESWRWTCKDFSEGMSLLEEI